MSPIVSGSQSKRKKTKTEALYAGIQGLMNENLWLDLSLVLWSVDSHIGQRPRRGLVLEQVLH